MSPLPTSPHSHPRRRVGPDDAGPIVLLASRSPRRSQLLDEHNIAHKAVHPGFDDASLEPGGVTPAQWVASLAYLKAWAGAHLPEACRAGGAVVIAADTTCELDGRMIGTPRIAAEAKKMIRAFAGRAHAVHTGLAVIDLRGLALRGSHIPSVLESLGPGRKFVTSDSAIVRVGELTAASVDSYIASGGWRGKAGAYNISDRVDAGWPVTFTGDMGTIMGLPMRILVPHLRAIAPGAFADSYER